MRLVSSGEHATASDGRALMSAPGQELLRRLADVDVSPAAALSLSASLRAEYPADLVAAALTQQALRVAGRVKFGLADQMLFTRSGLEQASSEPIARHTAARFAGATVVADLCCGIGGNLIALASAGEPLSDEGQRRLIGVDSDQVSLELARHNLSVYAPSSQAAFVCADVREFALTAIQAIYIDPARRVGQRRLPSGQYSPPLGWCVRLAEAVPQVGIKAAPGLRRDLIPPGWETEFVSLGRELKEALIWSPALATSASRATVLPSGDTLTPDAGASSEPVPLAPPGAFLFDPNPAVTRAGLVADLARRLGAWQIDPMIAFLSADEPALTPFARTLKVVESAPWHEKRFAARLRELGIGAADIRRRGLAGDVERIHRRLGLRGTGAAVLVLTRVADRPWGLICTPYPDPGPSPDPAVSPDT